jgi:hypothetical protein
MEKLYIFVNMFAIIVKFLNCMVLHVVEYICNGIILQCVCACGINNYYVDILFQLYICVSF